MQKVYLAQEVEEGDVIETIGIFKNYDEAFERSVELFEERGFSYSSDKDSDGYQKFEDEYSIESYIVR